MKTGTAHFQNERQLLRYYARQGDDGREAMNEGRAFVGVPDHNDGDKLTVDLDGRYWIEAAQARTFYLQHGHGTQGPFSTEPVKAYEEPKPQKRRGTVTACRFVIYWRGRRFRLFSDSAARGYPHFIVSGGERVAVSGVSP